MNPLDKLRSSQKANIHLARALIMNPEVMVMHRPFMHFPAAGDEGGKTAERIRDVFLEHRDNRGFQMDISDKHLRRPRTMFFTPDSSEEAAIADICWMLPSDIGGQCRSEAPSKAYGNHSAPSNFKQERQPRQPPPQRRDPPQAAPRPSTYEAPPPRQQELPPEPKSAPPPPAVPESKLKYAAESMPRPGLLKQDRDAATPQSAVLKQEILALGPRPMSSLGYSKLLEQSPNASGGENLAKSPYASGIGSPGRPTYQDIKYEEPIGLPGVDPAAARLRKPNMAEPMSTQTDPPPSAQPRERKFADPTDRSSQPYNRRCCGP